MAPVIAGLDPAIQTILPGAPAVEESLGCRVEPGNDT